MHGDDPNTNSLAFRMEYCGWVYTTGGDEGLRSMRRFLRQHPRLVRSHVRKVAHHLWGPLSVDFLRATDAHLYLVTNRADIVGMAEPWDEWDRVFVPQVVDYQRKWQRRIDRPG